MIIAQLLLAVGVLAAVAAVLRGPDLASRVIAFDTGVLATVGLLALDAAARGDARFLDALPVLGLLALVTTLAARRILLRPDGVEDPTRPASERRQPTTRSAP